MTDLLLYGDTERNAAMRHELPLAIGDPLLWAEIGGTAHVMTSALEQERIAAACPEAKLTNVGELGFHELLESGRSRDDVIFELIVRALGAWCLERVTVDAAFPLGLGDRLRGAGFEIVVDDTLFTLRRRAKSEAELDGIRRAQRAAEAAMAAAAAMLRSASVQRERLLLDGEPLVAEQVRAELRRVCAEHGASCPPDVIVASVQQGWGHEPGSGPLPADLPIQIDIWPRDELSGCWADMTRTFVVGEACERTRAQERLVTDALRKVKDAIRPGVTGRDMHALTCGIFEAAGHRTQRTGPGEDPAEGFQFSLGHGVGLEVHEAPGLGQLGRDEFVAGDVLALEPGLWEKEIGGVRFEDLVLVTPDGCETLTDYRYDLEP